MAMPRRRHGRRRSNHGGARSALSIFRSLRALSVVCIVSVPERGFVALILDVAFVTPQYYTDPDRFSPQAGIRGFDTH